MSDRPATVIFDLGDVILPFEPLKPCAALGARIGKTAQEVSDLIRLSNLERRFTDGKINGSQFAEGVLQALGVGMTTTEFHDLWMDMFTENRDVSAIIRQLKPHHHLMLLSNTNPWHWRHALDHYPIVAEFQNYILSYEIGVLKPHPAIYRAALEKLDPSAPVIFIDDIETNVAAARIMGIHGIHFQSAEQLAQELREVGCWF
jgi:HAD superfamily hydrolase (TIGR01509 family)